MPLRYLPCYQICVLQILLLRSEIFEVQLYRVLYKDPNKLHHSQVWDEPEKVILICLSPLLRFSLRNVKISTLSRDVVFTCSSHPKFLLN